MNSRVSSAVEQGSLLLARKPAPADISIEIVSQQKHLLGAVNLMFNVCGLEDKEIYAALDIDPGHFSNIRKGKTGHHFPTNKISEAMDLCGNEIPLIWLADRRGYVLTPKESEMERRLRFEKEAREKAEAERDLLRGLLTGRAMP